MFFFESQETFTERKIIQTQQRGKIIVFCANFKVFLKGRQIISYEQKTKKSFKMIKK